MRDLRIVFMGTPGFAVGVLQRLVESKKNIVGVITSPDRPAGRGRKLKASDVKQYAKAQGLNILQPTNLKDPEFLEDLKKLNANLHIVVAFRMLPRVVWNMPEFGTFNLHASLLPEYRGAAPINWAIINKETKTGVTTFFIDDKIDTGEVILRREVLITKRETVGSLHDRLMKLGAALVLDTLKIIEYDKVVTIPQSENKDLKEAPKLTKENTKIDWNLPVDDIDAFIRGLNPYPAAWSFLYNKDEKVKVKLYNCTPEINTHTFAQGKIIISSKGIKVAVSNGYLNIEEMQIPGKRKMGIKSLLNGYSFEENSKMM